MELETITKFCYLWQHFLFLLCPTILLTVTEPFVEHRDEQKAHSSQSENSANEFTKQVKYSSGISAFLSKNKSLQFSEGGKNQKTCRYPKRNLQESEEVLENLLWEPERIRLL